LKNAPEVENPMAGASFAKPYEASQNTPAFAFTTVDHAIAFGGGLKTREIAAQLGISPFHGIQANSENL
jgi:hypothetical protein